MTPITVYLLRSCGKAAAVDRDGVLRMTTVADPAPTLFASLAEAEQAIARSIDAYREFEAKMGWPVTDNRNSYSLENPNLTRARRDRAAAREGNAAPAGAPTG